MFFTEKTNKKTHPAGRCSYAPQVRQQTPSRIMYVLCAPVALLVRGAPATTSSPCQSALGRCFTNDSTTGPCLSTAFGPTSAAISARIILHSAATSSSAAYHFSPPSLPSPTASTPPLELSSTVPLVLFPTSSRPLRSRPPHPGLRHRVATFLCVFLNI